MSDKEPKSSPWARAEEKAKQAPATDSEQESAPRSEKRHQDKRSEDKPAGRRPERAGLSDDARPWSKPQGARSGKSDSDKPRFDKPRSDKPRTDRPRKDSPRFDKPRTEKPRPQRSRSESGDSPSGASLYGPKTATGLHPQNPHQGRYDMAALVADLPELERFLTTNPSGEQTVDFSKNSAVVTLNRALLKHHYGIAHWHLPEGSLCPPVPGRADYLYHVRDLLGDKTGQVRVLDIGTGANLIYPMIGSQAFGWQFVATDADSIAIRNAHKLLTDNPQLAGIDIRMQRKAEQVFTGMIREGEYFDLTLCNPPFYASQKEAEAQARRKWRNLKGRESSVERNFGGQSNELWCEGGELAFLKRLMRDSANFGQQVGWFTALVSKDENVAPLKRLLRQLDAVEVKVVPMAQGQKQSRFIAWRF